MEKQEEKVFRSRISILFLSIFVALFIRSILMINILVMCFMGVTVILIALLIGGMRYIILEDKLYLKIWTMSFWSVKIASIKSVERSYNGYSLSSPTLAASFKKLRITYDGKANVVSTLISPVKEQEFIEQLKIINPNIHARVPLKERIWRIQDWDF
jgi:hypothetical protein